MSGPLPSPGAIFKCGFRFGLPAGEVLAKVGLYFAYTGGPPLVADAIDLANTLKTAYSAHLASLAASEIVLEEITMTDLSSPTGAVGISTGSTIPGTRGSSDIVSPICAQTLYGMSRRYRGGRPRSYWPFGVSGDLGSFNQWGSGFIADVDAGVPAFITAALAASHGGVALSDWVSVSFFHGFTNFTEPSGRERVINTPRTTPLVDPLTYVGINPIYGVQKRRRGRV